MRITAYFGRQTVLARQEYKRIKFGDKNIRVLEGFVIGLAYKEILPRLKDIDWREIANTDIPNVTSNDDEKIVGVQTTLNLEQTVLTGIESLRKTFVSIFGTKKIYRPYVMKLILFAAILEANGTLKTNKEETTNDND